MKYKSDKQGELIPTVIVEFNDEGDLWMTLEEYNANGKFQGLIKAGYPLRNIVKVHKVLKNPTKYPTEAWPC